MNRVHGGARRNRSMRWFAVLAVVGLTAMGCGGGDSGGGGNGNSNGAGSEPEAASEPKAGGVLRYGKAIELRTWLPWVTELSDTKSWVYDTLLTIDEDGEWAPHMADMESEDATVWTMTLEKDITFSDGTPLDAEAVKFNLEQVLDPKTGSDLRSLLTPVTAMRVVDPTTLEITLSEPNGTFPLNFTSRMGLMVSPTAFRADPAGFAEKPVGAGPFLLESWTRDSRASFVPNPNYWGKKPYLEGIEVVVIPDEASRAQALSSGEVDAAFQVSELLQKTVEGNDDYRRASPSANGGEMLVPNRSRPPFDDVRIREALVRAIDPALINQSVMFGTWEDGSFSCPPFSPEQPECVDKVWPQYDLNRAKQLVAAYVAEKGALKGGYNMMVLAQRMAAAEALQQMWSAVGIDFVIDGVTGAEYSTRLGNQSYDVGMVIIVPFNGPPRSLYRSLYSKAVGGRHTQGGPDDLALDALMDKASGAARAEDRLAATKEFQRLAVKDVLSVWIKPSAQAVFAHKDVHVPNTWAGEFFGRPAEIWLDR